MQVRTANITIKKVTPVNSRVGAFLQSVGTGQIKIILFSRRKIEKKSINGSQMTNQADLSTINA